MITKQELEEKIAKGKSVWCIYQDEKEVDILPINKSMKWKIRENNLIVEEDWFSPIKYLFNSRAEAEHFLHHANISRTEKLPFLTWEELLETCVAVLKNSKLVNGKVDFETYCKQSTAMEIKKYDDKIKGKTILIS